jgi:succinoglycan biosynthesis transport protein ExoP
MASGIGHGTATDAEGGREFDQIKRHLLVVWRGRFWVLGVWALVMGAAAGIAYVLPNMYQSSTMILVERQKIPEAYVRSTVTEGMQERLKTITQQILSRTQISQVIEEYDLLDEPSVKERVLQRMGIDGVPWVHQWARKLGWVRDPDAAPSMEGAIDRFRNRVRIKVVGNQAFSVAYEGYDPVVVMRVTNAMAGMFISENLKIREQLVSGTTQFLDTQLDEARHALEKKEGEVQAFRAKNLGRLPEQLDPNLRTLDRIQLDLQHSDEAINTLAQQRQFLQRQIVSVQEQLASLGEDAQVALNTSDPLAQQLARAQARLNELSVKYTDAYPEVVAVKAEIAEIKQKMEEAGPPVQEEQDTGTYPVIADLNRQIKQIDEDTIARKGKRERLEADFKEYQARVEATPKVEQELQKLQRDYTSMQGNYQSLLEKQLSAKLAENLEARQKGEQFRVIDPANLPVGPVSPNRRLLLLMGLVGGFGGGVALVIGLDLLRPRFRTSQDVSAILGLPVFTVVPRMKMTGTDHGS